MTELKNRRKWTPSRKLQIVIETLRSDTKLAQVCRREGVSPNLVYKWRKQLMSSAEAIFERKATKGEDLRIARLAAENEWYKGVIAEITAENLVLKKRSRTEQPRPTSSGVAVSGEGDGG
jgi:transposase